MARLYAILLSDASQFCTIIGHVSNAIVICALVGATLELHSDERPPKGWHQKSCMRLQHSSDLATCSGNLYDKDQTSVFFAFSCTVGHEHGLSRHINLSTYAHDCIRPKYWTDVEYAGMRDNHHGVRSAHHSRLLQKRNLYSELCYACILTSAI